jgi:hypothetical protein
MPPDAYFPDRITVLSKFPEEEKVAVSTAQVAVKPTEQKAPAPVPVEEPAEEPEVQATEVSDVPKDEEKK